MRGVIIMKVNIKRMITVGIAATCLAVPTSLFLNQRNVNELIQEQRRIEQEAHKVQIQEHEQETEVLLNQIQDLCAEIEGLNKINKELQSKNNELEGVRFTISNNLGYEVKVGEIILLQKLVEAEAGGESMPGKIAVVNVVMNRIRSNSFPDTITDVIYQKNQFEPVVTGVIYKKTPSDETKEAVRRALMGESVIPEDIVNFWATWLDKNNHVWNHLTPVLTIGVHHFAREWED